MRIIVGCLVTACAFCGAAFSTTQESRNGDLRIAIRIYDYSHVPDSALSDARAIVTRLYEMIGVRTEWTGVMRNGRLTALPSCNPDGPGPPAAQLTIMVLTPQMADRGRVKKDVMGYAAVAADSMGRIAYLIYERVRTQAAAAAMRAGRLMGFVMAHEIGHLLLPGLGHRESGLMKHQWNARDLRQMNEGQLAFLPSQADRVRRTIEDHAASLSATPRVATADVSTTCASTNRQQNAERSNDDAPMAGQAPNVPLRSDAAYDRVHREASPSAIWRSGASMVRVTAP
jgi:hypothetical protein